MGCSDSKEPLAGLDVQSKRCSGRASLSLLVAEEVAFGGLEETPLHPHCLL